MLVMSRGFGARESGFRASALPNSIMFENTDDDGGKKQNSRYLALLDAGRLPSPLFPDGNTISSDKNAVMKLLEYFEKVVPKSDRNKEHMIQLDAAGRLVGFFKGREHSVYSEPSKEDPVVKRDGYWQALHRMTAGGGQIHNHPGYGLNVSGGLSPSDFAWAAHRLEAFCVATSNEGTYVFANLNWKKDYEAIERAAAAAQRKGERMGLSKKDVDEMRSKAYADASEALKSKALKLSDKMDDIRFNTYRKLYESGRLPEDADLMNEKQQVLYERYVFQASRELVEKSGNRLFFIPKKGFDMIDKPIKGKVSKNV